MNDQNGTVRSVDRALSILKCFTQKRSKIGLSEMSRLVDLPKSTVYRLLMSLKKSGFLIEDRTTETYCLSMLMFRLGNVAALNSTILDASIDDLDRVSSKTNETVSLNIVVGLQRVAIKQLESSHDLRQFVKVGEGLPLCSGASGNSLLAYLPKDQIKEIYQKEKAEGTVSKNFEDLLEKLKEIRNKGFAYSEGDRIQGATAISAPIFDNTGACVASVTVSGPSVRFTNEKADYFIKSVVDTAASISKKLGFEGVD